MRYFNIITYGLWILHIFFFQFEIFQISRSREVHQSWITTVLSTAVACIQSFSVLLKYKFDLVILFLRNIHSNGGNNFYVPI